MSVLFGCVDFTGKPFEARLREALCRTPEGIVGDEVVTLTSQPGIFLGVVRQHLIDYPSEAFAGPADDIHILADVRLDNREELAAQLGIHPGRLRDTPDDTLLLMGYLKWGERLPEKLLGDFAFVILEKNKRRLFAARDLFGVRPFYYAFLGERLFFNSQISRMARILPRPLTPNDRAIVGSFVSSFWFPGQTVAEEIRKLDGGHSLSLQAGSPPIIRQYRELTIPEPVWLGSNEAYAEALEELLKKAVRTRSQTDRPLAAQLSCGLDSATVAILAARGRSRQDIPFHASSWNPDFATIPPVDEDERTIISDICMQEGMMHRFAPFDGQALNRLMAETPYLAGGHYNPYLPYSLGWLRDAGVRSMVVGLGGDEFVSLHGRGYFAELLNQGKWLRFFSEAHRLSRKGGGSSRQILHEMFALAPPPLQRFSRSKQLSLLQRPLLRPKFSSIISEIEACRPAVLPCDVKSWQIQRSRHYHTARLERDAECADIYGIRNLCPLLDIRLVEFILAIPTSQHLEEGWHRSLLRRSTGGILPPAIRQRRSKREPALDRMNERYWKSTRTFLEARNLEVQTSEIFHRYLDKAVFESHFLKKEDALSSLLTRRASLNVLGLQSLLFEKERGQV